MLFYSPGLQVPRARGQLGSQLPAAQCTAPSIVPPSRTTALGVLEAGKHWHTTRAALMPDQSLETHLRGTTTCHALKTHMEGYLQHPRPVGRSEALARVQAHVLLFASTRKLFFRQIDHHRHRDARPIDTQDLMRYYRDTLVDFAWAPTLHLCSRASSLVELLHTILVPPDGLAVASGTRTGDHCSAPPSRLQQ